MALEADTIPTICLGDCEETVKLLRSACMDVGFFYLQGHGIDENLINDVLQQSNLLFNLSEKSKKALSDPVLSRGYTAMSEETLDPQKQKQGDTKEGFYIGKHVPADHPEYNPAKFKGPNRMPSSERTPDMANCEQFCSVMETYHEEMCQLGFRIVQLLALSLGLPKNFFDKDFEDPMALLRLLHYDAVKSIPEEGIYAAGEHTDYGMITLLLTDGTPGLQVLSKSGQWIDVPHRKNAFVVNLGDMLERWSNGMFRSTPHRVVMQGESERYSVPFFYEPTFDARVVCLDVCCSEDNPPKFEPTTSGLHLLDKYRQTHADFRPK